MPKLQEYLKTHQTLLCDGATGTNYFDLGLETGHPPELWNIEHPEHVMGLHHRFLAAGSDIILTNSFGGTSYRLKLHDAQNRVRELNGKAAALARQVVDRHHDETGKSALVAGSIGPTGELFAPLGALDHDAAVTAFTEQAESLAEGGVDLLWVETISSLEEVDAALQAALNTGLDVVATMTFDTAGKSMMGITPEAYAAHVQGQGASALGANCGIGPAELMHSIMKMQNSTEVDLTVPVVAKGNCGIPEYIDGSIHYHGSPELMARYAVLARDAGASIIGGCCGTTPHHIEAMRTALDTIEQEPFDEARLVAELGKPWGSLPLENTETDGAASASGGRKGRRGRRSR